MEYRHLLSWIVSNNRTLKLFANKYEEDEFLLIDSNKNRAYKGTLPELFMKIVSVIVDEQPNTIIEQLQFLLVAFQETVNEIKFIEQLRQIGEIPSFIDVSEYVYNQINVEVAEEVSVTTEQIPNVSEEVVIIPNVEHNDEHEDDETEDEDECDYDDDDEYDEEEEDDDYEDDDDDDGWVVEDDDDCEDW